MATTPPSNPFAALARNLADSKLAGSAVSRNLAARTALTRHRSAGTAPGSTTSRIEVAPPRTGDTLAQPTRPAEPALEGSAARAGAPKYAPAKPAQSFAALAAKGRQQNMAPPTSAAQAKPALAAAAGQRVRFPAAGSAADALQEGLDIDESDLVSDDEPSEPARPARAAPSARSSSGATGGRSIVYSDEQKRVIECNDRLIVVDAFAGCAKTTTAVGYANHRPKERILYLCLNKANADEAQGRFGANVTAATTHSVAWRAMKPNKERITTRWKPLLLMDMLRLRGAREAMVTMRILNDFFNSSDVTISEKHAAQVAFEHDLDSTEVMNAVAYATLAWKRMLDPSDKMLMPHDAYLKMFALKAPELPYDTIIFDEAQDANPVTLQIVRGQKRPKLLCIGDRHQSIYQFRGSVNAMEQLAVGATHLHLSKTWRFGPGIAEVANHLLRELKGERVPIEGMGKDEPWRPERVTTLSRTNAELFRLAAPTRGEGVHWVGGVENYRLELVMDAYHLFARERTLIQDPLMKSKFTNWDDYSKYAEDANDGEAKVLVRVVEEFGHDVPELVADIRTNAVETSDGAACTLTTAHKAKGLEWDYVRLGDDFEVLEEAERLMSDQLGADLPIQDINLLYVAATRAKKAVQLNPETVKWLEDLPKHRANREAAQSRLRSQLNGFSGPAQRP